MVFGLQLVYVYFHEAYHDCLTNVTLLRYLAIGFLLSLTHVLSKGLGAASIALSTPGY